MTDQETINILTEDINHLQKQVADAQDQIQRLVRTFELDIHNKQRDQDTRIELMEAIRNSNDYLGEILNRERERDHELATDRSHYYTLRQDRRKKTLKNLAYAEYLNGLVKKVTSRCPCGMHRGIAFYDEAGEKIKEVCPINWWVTLTRIAFEKGKLKTFKEEYPLKKYLQKYSIS